MSRWFRRHRKSPVLVCNCCGEQFYSGTSFGDLFDHLMGGCDPDV